MKMTRDIRSSLELARRREAPSRIRLTEDKLKKELEDEFGTILDEDERAKIKDIAGIRLKKLRMKIFRQKEKAKVLLAMRMRSGNDPEGENVGRIAKKETRPKKSEKKVFNEISFEY